jgi:hypothetical protein
VDGFNPANPSVSTYKNIDTFTDQCKTGAGAARALFFCSPVAAQNLPPAPRAEHVEITKGRVGRADPAGMGSTGRTRGAERSRARAPPRDLLPRIWMCFGASTSSLGRRVARASTRDGPSTLTRQGEVTEICRFAKLCRIVAPSKPWRETSKPWRETTFCKILCNFVTSRSCITHALAAASRGRRGAAEVRRVQTSARPARSSRNGGVTPGARSPPNFHHERGG